MEYNPKVNPFTLESVRKQLQTNNVDELILDALADFLLEPIGRQFWTIFIEASSRSSTKLNVKSNENVEVEAEN